MILTGQDPTEKLCYDYVHNDCVHNVFHDRKREMKTLEKAFQNEQFESVVIYGRRRMGGKYVF